MILRAGVARDKNFSALMAVVTVNAGCLQAGNRDVLVCS
jgi:hypothetical protein